MAEFVTIDRDDMDEEADRFAGFPHPREMLVYLGPTEQERLLLDAYRSGRMHHGWLLAGPEGVGKAVLAYRFAKFVLANPDPASPSVQAATSLAVPADHPVTGQVARLSHPDLAVMRRTRGKDSKTLRSATAVDDVREALSVFRTTSASGGWRIVIIDPAEDLNRNSANALLKMLEEPPERALFLVVAQRLGALLPTIRSRCRIMKFQLLSGSAVARIVQTVGQCDVAEAAEAAETSGGSARVALSRLDKEAKQFRAMALKVLDGSGTGGKAVQAFAESLTGKPRTGQFQLFLDLVEERLRQSVRDGGPARVLAARAELWEKLRRSARDVETFNLDRRPFILSTLAELAEIERHPR